MLAVRECARVCVCVCQWAGEQYTQKPNQSMIPYDTYKSKRDDYMFQHGYYLLYAKKGRVMNVNNFLNTGKLW